MKIYCANGSNKQRSLLAFTLLEVMVSVVVIIVTMVTVFATMGMSFSMTEASRENLRATQIMLDKMEGLRLYSWTQLTNSTFLKPAFTNWFYETNNIGEFNAGGNGVAYTGLVAVVSVPFTNAYSSVMVEVDVTVGWTSSGAGWSYANNNHIRKMNTFVTQAGMQNYIFNSSISPMLH